MARLGIEPRLPEYIPGALPTELPSHRYQTGLPFFVTTLCKQIAHPTQTSYIDSIIMHFNLNDAKSYWTPMVLGAIYSKQDSPSDATEAAQMKKVLYHKAIGSLMYTAVATHPDISHSVSTLSHFLDNPSMTHWEAIKHMFCYLVGTWDFALTYGAEHHDLISYTDTDGAIEEHRHAISGYTFIIDGGAISWYSHKQELITLSTAEAEYIPTLPTTIFCNNQAAIKLAYDDNYHAHTKHINIWYHFIRQVVSEGIISLVYCPKEDMAADFLTKSLPKWKVLTHACTLGLHCVWGGVLVFPVYHSECTHMPWCTTMPHNLSCVGPKAKF